MAYMQRQLCKACSSQGAARSRTPSTNHKGRWPFSNLPGQWPAQVSVCTSAHAAAAVHEALQQQQLQQGHPPNSQQRQQQQQQLQHKAFWHGHQQLQQEQDGQIVPGRTLHSQQTDELLWMLHSAQAVQQQQQPVPRQQQPTVQQHNTQVSAPSMQAASAQPGPINASSSSRKGTDGTAQHRTSLTSSSSNSRKQLANGNAPAQLLSPTIQQQQQQQLFGRRQQQLSDAALLVQMMKGCRQQQQLLALIAAHVAEVDPVAAAAAVLYYAKLVVPDAITAAADDDGAGQQQQQQQQVVSSTRLPLLLRHLLLLHMRGFKARQYANTLYALGRMHCRDKPLVDLLVQGLLQNRDQRHYIAGSSSSVAVNGSSSSSSFQQARRFRKSADLMSQLKPQEVANITWGLGRLRLWPDHTWMQRFYEVSAGYLQPQQQQQHCDHRQQRRQQQQGFTPQELANMVWGLGRLHATPPRSWLLMLLPVLDRQMVGFSPQQLSNTIWGLAQMGGPRPRAQDHVGLVSSSSGSSSGGSSSSSSSSRRKGLGVTLPPGFVSRGCDHARAQLPRFTVQEISNLTWGLARLQQQQQQQQQLQDWQGLMQQMQLAEAACRQLVGGKGCAAAAVQLVTATAAVDHDQQHASDSAGSSSSSSCLTDIAARSLMRPKHGHICQRRQQQRSQQHGNQVQQQQQLRQLHSHVRASQVAKVLGSYRGLLLLHQARLGAAVYDGRSDHHQQQHELPQQLLHQLAGLLSVYCPINSTSGSSSSSSISDQQRRSLTVAETPGFCQTLLLLAQLGYTPNPSYLAATLEVLHDKLHVLNPRDFEVITQCLEVLGYMPAETWVRAYLRASQHRFRNMRPEGLARLLVWALQYDQWFSTRRKVLQQWTAAASSGLSPLAIPAAAAPVQAAVLPCGVCIRSGVMISADWISDLLQNLRSKVACRAAAAVAATVKSGTAATLGTVLGSSSSSSMYNNVDMMDRWLLQQLHQHALVAEPVAEGVASGDVDSNAKMQVADTAAVGATQCYRHQLEVV